MHEAPKYFRSDFMPREMERLGLAEKERKREKGGERRGEGEGGMVTVFGKGSREGQSTPPHVLAMRG